jgi:aryl-alcohol dehydrogenase-like predicted oxidoreductase
MTQQTASAAAAGSLTIGGDMTVHRLGFGAMRITGRGIWGPPPDRERAKAVLRRAIERGVTFIDTADSYGPNVSEELIGEALAPYPADVVIATKAGLVRPGPDDWAVWAACDASASISTSSTGPIRRCRSKNRSARSRNCSAKAKCDTSGSPTSP